MTSAEPAEGTGWVGRRLREARRRRELTLAEAAQRAGVSGAHLSRLEKGERQPSIAVLLELARAYRTTVGELLGERPGRPYHLVRGADAPLVMSASGPCATLTGAGTAITAVRLDLPTGAESGQPTVRHHGDELLYVLSGEVGVDLDGERLRLATGDSLHFDARMPHLLANPGGTPASVLIISAPSAHP